jgi:hypothetical protein
MAAQPESDLRRERAAQNESLFRAVNERIEEIASSFKSGGERNDFICECARSDCISPIQMTVHEYEAVRSAPTQFMVANGHEVPDVERVVVSTNRYTVVEKIGAAGAVAMELDPRSV